MRSTLPLSCTLVLAGISHAVAGGSEFSLTRGVIATGGGTSSGGAFSVTGTTGETGAGSMVCYGARFDLASGFWAGRPAVMWPEAEIIEVGANLRKVLLAPARTTWRMDFSRDLGPWQPLYTNSTLTWSKEVQIAGPPGQRFFLRLVRLAE